MRTSKRPASLVRLSTLTLSAFFALAGFTACDSGELEPEAGDRMGEADHDARMMEKFAELDTDDDGAISAAEAEGHRWAKKFDEIDADGDGLVTPDELAALRGEGMHGKHKRGEGKRGGHGPKFAKLDVDGDGSVSIEEAKDSRIARDFPAIDADSNDLITQEEMQSFGEKMRDPAFRAQTKMTHQDADGDGQLSMEEMAAGHRKHRSDKVGADEDHGTKHHEKQAERFASIDTDGSGGVSLEELVAHEEARKDKRHTRGHHDKPRHRHGEGKRAEHAEADPAAE